MKTIKNVIEIIVLLVLLIIGISSCMRNAEKKLPDEGNKKIVKLYSNEGIYAYNVDGHIYIFNMAGGVIHSESCPCKKR